ncbi:transporter [Rhizoctonia solani]|uniref:Transporter n=1 Tax=Rhizoctonia solani TaxID=456999 RepID=A0A8H7I7A7_9AGAM|nr:transporter [Rhizoctonia solani]
MGVPDHHEHERTTSEDARPPSRSATLRRARHPNALPVGFARGLIITLACTLAMVNNIMSGASISIALPEIGKDLGISQADLQWLVSAYSLTSGCFLLLFGRLADLFGRKKAFLLGNVWFLAWAIGCGFAPDAISLDVMRALQGMGAAATIPSAVGILAHEFPPSAARSIAFATFSAGAPLGGAIGFVIGGLMTEYTSVRWRGVFYVSAGLAALTILAGALGIHRDTPSEEQDRRIDWVGAFLSTAALVLLTFSLAQSSSAPDGWRTPYIPVILVISIFRPPLMRLGLWTRANGKFAAIQLVVLFNWSCFTTWQFFVTWVFYCSPSTRFLTILLATKSIWGCLLSTLLLDYSPCRSAGYFVISSSLSLLAASREQYSLRRMLLHRTGRTTLCSHTTIAHILGIRLPSRSRSRIRSRFHVRDRLHLRRQSRTPARTKSGRGIFNTLNQLGTAFGLAIASVVNNSVYRQSVRASGDEVESLLLGYRAAFWTCFGFGMAALVLTLVFLRGIGIVGHETKSSVQDGDDQGSREKGECKRV